MLQNDKMENIPILEDLQLSFMQKNLTKNMQNKVVLPMLLGILAVGITQFAFAEEEKTNFIAIDEEEFKQPQSKHTYQEVTIFGYIEDYTRGAQATIEIINPDNTKEELSIVASKKGDVYTLLHFTVDSQVGVHQITLIFNGEQIASTSLEVLENQ